MSTDTSSQGSYSYDFSAFSQAATASGGQDGMTFLSGAAAGSPPTSAAAGPAAGGGGDPTALIAQSPFGALLDLPGVTAANLFSNVNPADYGGGNPFAALVGSGSSTGAAAPYGGNPFASIGTLVSDSYAAATQGSGASAGSNPFSGLGGAGF